MSNSSFSHNVFYPLEELSDIFVKIRIVVCKLFQFGNVLEKAEYREKQKKISTLESNKKSEIFLIDRFSLSTFCLFSQCFQKSAPLEALKWICFMIWPLPFINLV